MENKIKTSNNELQDKKSYRKNNNNENKIQIKTSIKNYKLSNSELLPKKSETKFYTKITNQIKKPSRYIQQKKESKENQKKSRVKEKEKSNIIFADNLMNKTEIRSNNKLEHHIRNIKVNKINFDKNDFQNKTNIFNTNSNNQELNTIYLKKQENKNNSFNNNDNNKYSNKTTIVKKRINKDTIKFKDLKRFFAHIEIFLSLYLKKIFKAFLSKLKLYEK